MIDLTDLQEDILTLAVQNPDITNKEIADRLDCSENYAGEIRRKYEGSVDEEQISGKLNSVSNSSGSSGGLLSFVLFLIVAPFKLAIWVTLLPFRILGAIFGGSS
ncbi:hypothetical protein A4G99_21030 [Haladaptatus sp. R4]|uniref:hypothetical protein n=1 Tax=Haladaptatus sp. R4 TaxID=1679489 RepID=UPI0007B4B88B|nr:hypothetical protein [Haladaptatus sp. R4]KZN26524.1 hypothetical protein A4G99_21030 [Haladaptatus sp. R4]